MFYLRNNPDFYDCFRDLDMICVVNFQVASEELNVEKRVKEVCSQLKVKVHTCWGSTLYHRDDVPFRHMSRFEMMSIVFWIDLISAGQSSLVKSTVFFGI